MKLNNRITKTVKEIMKHRNNIIGTTIVFGLGVLGLSSIARAVSPRPDGGYAGGNTAEGQSALLNLTTGTYNTAIGYLSLLSNATNSFNTAIGAGALLANTADENTATGAAALLSNTSGNYNTADGVLALESNTIGEANTATGVSALLSNTTGTANTAAGDDSLFFNTQGNNNTALGGNALFDNTIGNGNTALGANAGSALTTGDNNIDIGHGVMGVAGESNTIRLGANLPDTPGASACHIGGIYQQAVDPANSTGVGIDATGKLGTVVSSRRFKHDIKAMDKASEAILALKPVTFHYKSDAKNTPCFGLIAEEVAEVNPDLVVRNKDGDIYTVRYDQVNAMLLNEFLKEHRKVETQARKMDAQEHKIREQEATMSELKKDLHIVVARNKDQDSKIQRVSAELEMSKRSPHVIATNP